MDEDKSNIFQQGNIPYIEESKRTNTEQPEDETKLEPVPYFSLFRFLTTSDKWLLGVALIASLVSSSCFPILNILFGEMAELMVNEEKDPIYCNGTEEIFPDVTEGVSPIYAKSSDIVDKMAQYSIYLVVTGVAQLICGYLSICIFSRLAEKQIYRLRKAYLSSLLRQNIGWYDVVQDRNFVSKMSENVTKVQDAIGDKVGLCLYYFLCSILCFVAALWYGWLLTLVILATTPIVAIATVIVNSLQTRLTAKEQEAYSKSGLIAQEALSNIKTVMAFSGQGKEAERYRQGLVFALSAGKKRGIVSSFGNGFLWFLNYASYSLAFWYGTKLVFESQKNVCDSSVKPEYGPAVFLVVFFNVLSGSSFIGQAVAYLEMFNVGRGAAASIYKVIERVPEIDSYDKGGKTPSERPLGRIEFNNVQFAYPSRKEAPILQGIHFAVEPGTTVALVGNSGCGKSTCLQLLQRFYDPESGSVSVDGMDIRQLNIGWYRSQLGVVSQEPFLFNATIAENIRYGKEDATQEEIENACRLSNAHSFVSRLPQRYDTMVGERGTKLSGGQKQRIAIARALIRNPSILILDEATSALDTQSEAVVQQALDKASQGRTTLIVAHRLSTIRNADIILAIKDGKVVEMGNHKTLLAQKGLYYSLVNAQTGGDIKSDDTDGSNASNLEPAEDQEVFEAIDETSVDEKNEELVLATRTSFFSLLKLNAPEWYWMALGLTMAVLQGFVLPMYAYFFGEFMEIFKERDADIAQKEANTYGMYFLGVGVYAGLTIGLSLSSFAIAGEALTNRLRKLSFESMLKQELAWYDDPKNSVGGLCLRLSGDAANVQGATGTRLGTVTYAVTTILISAGLAIISSPRLGAVAVCFVPFIIVLGYYNSLLLESQQIEEKAATEKASTLAYQAVSGIRTVASLCKEKVILDMYSGFLLEPYKKALRNSHVLGLVFGVSQGLLYFAYATVLYYGAYLIRNEGMEYSKVFIIGEALIWSMLMLGQTLGFAPNYNKAKVAGGRILSLIEKRPAVENTPGVGLQIKNCEGSVIFDKVNFTYPTRKNAEILKGLTFGIKPNTNIAICGPSGSGKSTCVQLILRYYDATSGFVKLDETDVCSLNLDALRSQMAIVAQEPALFDRSIEENIAYGDNSRNVTTEEIIEAARSANIHKFITSLPAGYATRVGDMGAQLSGGQKQRVAIARALVRKPKLLLLDEATSALDTESERVVQQALDEATVGRTSITIAHRLSSIQNADKILVVVNGELSESGTHSELLAQKGVYHKLWNMQIHGSSS